MEVNNGRKRSAKIRKGSKGSEPKGESRSLGAFSAASPSDGLNPFGASGEDSNQSDTFVPRQSLGSIPGEVISQLVDETEKQLVYHEQQAKLLRNRLEELKQIPNIPTHTE